MSYEPDFYKDCEDAMNEYDGTGDQRAAKPDCAGRQPSAERLCCPRCKEGTTFEISVKDAPGLWITCSACHWIINSAIS
jgi:uncharacterized protein (DUF983 family)